MIVGLGTFEVELNCLGLVALLQVIAMEKSTTQVLVNDILATVRPFDGCSFTCVKRSCNKAAHSMAKASFLLEEELVWKEKFPSDVLYIVLVDKALFE